MPVQEFAINFASILLEIIDGDKVNMNVFKTLLTLVVTLRQFAYLMFTLFVHQLATMDLCSKQTKIPFGVRT